MKISIVCVGKIKEKYYIQAIKEFEKRLSRYCSLEIIEVPDEKAPENLSPGDVLNLLDREGDKIMAKIPSNSYVITLEIDGKNLSSSELADHLEKCGVSGRSSICFVIGGSLGLSQSVKSLSDFKLSFSNMTFPHQLFRIMVLEQIYRSFKINRNEPYHK
ncbi:23S rRNA (pseudouridine(1915)-N(3))-methyltransferase RlmH [Alkalibacter mobilis]|uniref:23S rRNA (pseudouridine(1915)-N(3))-methyltransferase RlmH n=1 Tax=Alkalibacter mobilis TaxID=2787712 RepID=UPI00189DA217|nr:23S rRNA (pseudouridine(1915)-N(3))-methyltransferase RlmH [Alkalibacter mobilis]MBF7096978.1 23S rRNA (pseudouridine(1915)-N(3))-methyltransferase RlmH [Alkalibacter mobilis]